MLKHIRTATEAEIERIRKGSDIGGEPFAVYALDNDKGEADIAVVKSVIELDPVWFAPSSNSVTRAKFIQLLEERLMGAGVRRFLCNVHADEERWIQILKEWGFKQQSSVPEFRMARNLGNDEN